MQFIPFDHDRIDSTNQSRRLVDSVEMRHDRQLVRDRHAQTPQLPVHFPRRWADEVTNERIEILHRQWQVDAINAQCRERGVVNPWRTRMADRITDHTKNGTRLRQRLDTVKITQFGHRWLPGRALRPPSQCRKGQDPSP